MTDIEGLEGPGEAGVLLPAFTDLDDPAVTVSTIAVDDDWEGLTYYETRVFPQGAYESLPGEHTRYESYADAVEGHAAKVARWSAATRNLCLGCDNIVPVIDNVGNFCRSGDCDLETPSCSECAPGERCETHRAAE